MTPEQQRLALAKWTGWKFIEYRIGPDIVDVASCPWACLSGMNPKDDTMDGLPDFLNDLNAVHQLEGKLTIECQNDYVGMLYDLSRKTERWNHLEYELLHTTAAQRCEALLRTLGLWEE